jgi:beta-glucanase (GH16 family)
MNGYGPDYRGFHIPAAYDEAPKFEGKLNLAVDTESFHTFGMLWEPDGYSIYVDGRLRGRNRAAVSHVPEFVLLSTEAKWYRNNRMTGKGVPELDAAARAGDDFVVDYVRVYDVER